MKDKEIAEKRMFECINADKLSVEDFNILNLYGWLITTDGKTYYWSDDAKEKNRNRKS